MSMKWLAVAITTVGLLVAAGGYRHAMAVESAAAPAPAMPEIKSIKVLPEALTIENARDARRFLVMGETNEGMPVDLTHVAKAKLDSYVATLGSDGYVRARAPG